MISLLNLTSLGFFLGLSGLISEKIYSELISWFLLRIYIPIFIFYALSWYCLA